MVLFSSLVRPETGKRLKWELFQVLMSTNKRFAHEFYFCSMRIVSSGPVDSEEALYLFYFEPAADDFGSFLYLRNYLKILAASRYKFLVGGSYIKDTHAIYMSF